MSRLKKIALILILQLICFQQFTFAQDSIPVPKPVKPKFKPDSFKATMLAVSLPGMGQVYNRKYWKIPLVYAGFGGLMYSIRYNTSQYDIYLQAYKDFIDLIPGTDSYEEIIPVDPATYDPVKHPETYNAQSASYYKDAMLRQVDYYKRYRDLSYIGLGVWYMVTILDANVDASLFNYEVNSNLDITLLPMAFPLPGGFTGAGINVGMTITF